MIRFISRRLKRCPKIGLEWIIKIIEAYENRESIVKQERKTLE